MNCRDFDQTWNRLLDAESGPRRDDGPGATTARLDREAQVVGHAAACPSCRIRHRQFETLRAAMRVWSAGARPEPAPPAEVVDRIVIAASRREAPAPRRRWARPLAWASGLAAAAAATAFLRPPAVEAPRPEPAPAASLSVAVADVREASLRLAWSASEPAARLGLAMFDASTGDDSSTDDDSQAPDDDAPGAADLPARVGGYAAAGARPLSDAARQAFGFLRSPSLAKSAPTASPRGT